MKIRAVLHKNYGGFHLTDEIVDKMTAKGFEWGAIPPNKSCGEYVHYHAMNEFSFRSNPIFIEVVLELQKENNKLDWYEARKNYISGLSVVEVNLNVEVEDYHDGKERLTVNGREIYS
jgi:hypothetical protein